MNDKITSNNGMEKEIQIYIVCFYRIWTAWFFLEKYSILSGKLTNIKATNTRAVSCKIITKFFVGQHSVNCTFVCLNKVRRKRHLVHMVILHFSSFFHSPKRKKWWAEKSKNCIFFIHHKIFVASDCVCKWSEMLNVVQKRVLKFIFT